MQARIDEKKEKKAKEEERKKRKEAADLKGSMVQVRLASKALPLSFPRAAARSSLTRIRRIALQAVSTNTVKKMSRKQLRAIRKMDVHSEINPAPIQKTKGLNGKVKV